MRREIRAVIVSLVLFAAGSVAALLVVFWPTDGATTPSQTNSTPVPEKFNTKPAATEPFTGTSSNPELDTPLSSQIPDEASWELFMAACRSKSFVEAGGLVATVTDVPLQTKLTVLQLLHELELTMAEAKQFASILLALFKTSDGTAALTTCDAVIREIETCWPSIDSLKSPRKERYHNLVEGKPISVPERAGLVPADVLFVTIYMAVGESFPNPDQAQFAEVRYLFDRAADQVWTTRPFLEPTLSAMLGILVERDVAGIPALISPYTNVTAFTPRLRWELQLRASASGSLADLLALLEQQTDPNDVIAALRAAFQAGVDTSDLLQILAPYLESRFGSRSAANFLMMSMTSGLAKLSEEDWRKLGSATSEAFCECDPESGLATVYFAIFRETESARRLKQVAGADFQQVPDFSSFTRILSSDDNAKFRRALLDYWHLTAAGLQQGQLSTHNPVSICVAALEACENLNEAVEMLDAILAACRRPEEVRSLLRGFHFVIITCRGLFAEELASDLDLRRRLVEMTEGLLAVRSDERRELRGQGARASAMSGILLADQLLALCSIETPIKLTVQSAEVLRNNIANFEAEAFEPNTDPPALRKSLRKHQAPYQRVLEGMQDERLIPPTK